MRFQIFINELKRNKVINVTLFAFIMLGALLSASAANVMTMLTDGIDQLMTSCKTPHYMQMHAGEIDESGLVEFNNKFDYITDFQIVETISVDGADITFNDLFESEAASVMDICFVMQNQSFDYLLDMNNEIVKPMDNEIAVPLYYKGQRDLNIGDTLTLSNSKYNKTFTICAFIRDSQMNPSLVSSKRFVVSQNDYTSLLNEYNGREYLIEYRFNNLSRVDEFSTAYLASTMPKTGPAIDYNFFRLLNALTDGIIVLVLVLVSILLIVIGMLCLRFTLLGSIEEDTREIGVMKAIGIPLKNIKYQYMSKYILLSALACTIGYLLSFLLNSIFTANITQYMGAVSIKADTYIITAISVILVFALVVLSCYSILSRFKRLSAVKALTSRMGEKQSKVRKGLNLRINYRANTDIFLGVNAVLLNMRVYLLLCLIFVISIFIIVVPANLLNTLESDDFVKYMGVSNSHIRIDVRMDEDIDSLSDEVITYIKNDDDVKEYGVFRTYRSVAVDSEGELVTLPLEIGDFNLFPLEYIEGVAPTGKNQIALSISAANSIEKDIGDTLEVTCNEDRYNVIISGFYQDVTNGGKTAKANISEPNADVIWYAINLNIYDADKVKDKANAYGKLFNGTKVTYLQEYLNQTLGSNISQLRLVTAFATVIASAIASLISALFLKMLLAKDRRQIAILKSMGFSQENIALQYLTRMFTILIIGIFIGIVLAATLGESLVGAVASNFGAPGIEFVVNPLTAYVVAPLLLGVIALLTGYIVIRRFRPANISRMIIE